jgi:hypothetical protein
MRLIGPVISLFVLSTLLEAPVEASPSALSLMQKSEDRHRLGLEQIEAVMVLQKQGASPYSRRLRMTISQNKKKGDRSLIRFSAPANIKDTAMLSLEDEAKDSDEQWLYLPAFRRTRRIGVADLGDRFVGSDFFFEDLKARDVNDYSYRHLRSETWAGKPCWVIESVPKSAKVRRESPYKKSIVWLTKDRLFVIKLRHFDRRGKPLKELRAAKLVKVGRTAWRANRIEVIDVRRRHRTVLLIKQRKTAIKLLASFFSRHSLRR